MNATRALLGPVLRVLFVGGFLALAAPGVALGQSPPAAQRGQLYSEYEVETLEEQLAAAHAERDPAPEGKRIERIDVVPLDVIEPRDPAPAWLNLFHATTREGIIRREMLLREGDPYQQAVLDQTIRNLRRLPELSLILIAAARGSAPDRVVVFVVTKDVWSLRASWNIVATPGGVEDFLLAPTETNLLGSHQTVRGTYRYQPSASTFGLGYTIPRIGTSRIAVVASADVVVNRQSGSPEGTYGSVVTGQPLFSGRPEWAWDASFSWQDQIVRQYTNAEPAVFLDPQTGGAVFNQYRARELASAVEVTRSLGWDRKNDFTLAWAVDATRYPVNFAGQDPRTEADFKAQYVPLDDTRAGPFIRYHAYENHYLRVIDFETLALQEDFRLGYDFVLRVFPSLSVFGATRNLLSVQSAVQYTVPMRDGLARVALSSLTEPDVGLRGAPVAYGSITPTVHLASPSVGGLGRIVVDGTFLYRYRDYLNVGTYLGGESRLRGFPTNFFFGRSYFAYNLEARSHPVEVLTCQLAGVVFYDIGHAFNAGEPLRPFQSVGFGLRALFPQLDRMVFRADLGFPMQRVDLATGRALAPVGFLVSFGQAFDVPTVSPAPVLPTGL